MRNLGINSMHPNCIKDIENLSRKHYIEYDPTLSEEFLVKFKYKMADVSWSHIAYCYKLSHEFIEYFADYMDWFAICQMQKLSEHLISKFKDKMYWDLISFYQNLSENSIREHSDKLVWRYICQKQRLSEELIRENSSRINWEDLKYNPNIELTEAFYEEFKDYLE